MVIASCILYLKADWVNSLKEKRMVVKSLIEKSKHKFNISIAEVDMQDSHKDIVIGFACVTNQSQHADSIVENVINFIEKNTEAYIYDIQKEIL